MFYNKDATAKQGIGAYQDIEPIQTAQSIYKVELLVVYYIKDLRVHLSIKI